MNSYVIKYKSSKKYDDHSERTAVVDTNDSAFVALSIFHRQNKECEVFSISVNGKEVSLADIP